MEALKNGVRRTWGLTTLNKFDGALGLEAGRHALPDLGRRPGRARRPPTSPRFAAQMRLMQTKLAEMTERPWAAGAIAVLAELDPADRYRVIDLARQLARR